MNLVTPVVTDDQQHASTARSRDADATRRLLLQSARRRFALDGYSATKVRDIATDAGVNVALINRYFDSKEGLFESCLSYVAEELGRPTSSSLGRVVDSVVSRVASPLTAEGMLQLLLLIRTSGDERADRIRRDTLHSFAERIAGVAGWRAGDGDDLLLRAEIAICTALGIALLRSTTGLDPLTSATEADLAKPIEDVFSALLGTDA